MIHIYAKITNFGAIKYNKLMKKIEKYIKRIINDEDNINELNYKISFQQLYSKIIKELFVFNRLGVIKVYFLIIIKIIIK